MCEHVYNIALWVDIRHYRALEVVLECWPQDKHDTFEYFLEVTLSYYELS